MPSYSRLTRTQQVFVANQTFEQYIVINGQRVRPFAREGPNGTTVIGWEQNVSGQWVVTNEREYP